MANNHGVFDRIGLSIQESSKGVIFPGWVSNLNKRSHGSPDGWVAESLHNVENLTPMWLSDTVVPNLSISREYNIGYGRYPNKCTARHRYEMTHIVGGRSSQVYCVVAFGGTNRAAQVIRSYGSVRMRTDIIYVDGDTWTTDWQQMMSSVYSFGVRKERNIYGTKQIQSVTIKLEMQFGDVAYHDPGDRSPRSYAPYVPLEGGNNVGHALYGANVNRLVEYEGEWPSAVVGTPTKTRPIPAGTEDVQYIDYAGYNGWGNW